MTIETGKIAKQANNAQDEANLTQSATESAAHYNVGRLTAMQIDDRSIYCNCQLRQITPNRKNGRTDDELGDAEPFRY